MFGEVPDSPEVVLPPTARRPLGRKAAVLGTVLPPPPRYVEYTNCFVPLKLGSSFITKVSVVPLKVVWKPFGWPETPLKSVAERVGPPAIIFPLESSPAPQAKTAPPLHPLGG